MPLPKNNKRTHKHPHTPQRRINKANKRVRLTPKERDTVDVADRPFLLRFCSRKTGPLKPVKREPVDLATLVVDEGPEAEGLPDSEKDLYRVLVRTGDRLGAGTDRDITIVLHGSHGKTAQVVLDDERNNFENGQARVLLCARPRSVSLRSRRPAAVFPPSRL